MDDLYKNTFLNTKENLLENDLLSVEKRFNFKMPKVIFDHYLIYDGGYPEKYIFIDNSGSRYEVEHFIPIKNPDGDRTLGKILTLLREDSILPSWLIPLADEAGGDFYCYSLREHELGAIYYWSHEFDFGENPEAHARYLASSIIQFVNGMVEE